MTKLKTFFCLILLTGKLAAAGPIVHAYLTERYFLHYPVYNEEQKKEFMLGTLFPDIRYISPKERGDTHFEMLTLQDVIKEPSPFLAGMKFHSWVDDERNLYVVDSKIYQVMNAQVKAKQRPTFLKIVEDEAVHSKVDWKKCCLYLETIDEKEHSFGIEPKIIEQWHQILTVFFRSSPASVVTLLSMSNLGKHHLSAEDAQVWSIQLQEKLKQPAMRAYIDGMLDYFEKKLTLSVSSEEVNKTKKLSSSS